MEQLTTQNPLESIDIMPEYSGISQKVIENRYDFDYGLGLICLGISFAIFIAASLTYFADGVFILPYGAAVFYSIWLNKEGKLRWFWKRQPIEFIHHRMLLGYLWLVSCFSFNHVMPLFNTSAPWLVAAILITGAAAIIYTWEDYLPRFLRHLLLALIASSAVLWLYYAICLFPIFPIGLIGLLLLGFSMHAFIPLLLSITYIRLISQKWRDFKFALLAGIIIPVAILVYFSVRWHHITKSLTHQAHEVATRPTEELPDWVMLARKMESDWITRRVILGENAYQLGGSPADFSFLENPRSNALAVHDPLVAIASYFSPNLGIFEEERTKIMDVLYDTRHDTQERLWSGSHLRTDHVLTQVRVYPEVRIAYTEKTISIANQSGSAFSQEEALYTFYLPEGSVVSSLSLWINGVEEKGYLTTQSKADSAYKTIVGVESRDPSVVHWQEGNMIKVKVFPCATKENRRFKIGITSPLQLIGNDLIYENIWFKGPGAANASETVRLEFPDNATVPRLSFEATESGQGFVVRSGDYQSSWNARFKTVPLTRDRFAFDGKSYAVEALSEKPESFSAEAFYLDINNAWTRAELDALWPLIKNKPVYVADEGITRLTDANKDELFKTLSAFNFSTFPTFRIAQPETSLLITKSTGVSPTLRDLSKTPFAKMLRGKNGPAVRTFIVGNEPSPYIKSLNELRIIRGEKMDWERLKSLIIKNQFPADAETDPSIVRIDQSKTQIRVSESVASGQAPDHLLRLFAYNHIMQQVGGHYLDQSFHTDSILNAKLIGEAEAAHIVTPVSSMVVLESQRDYDRFDIRKSKNSLDNATLKSSGAVPEPHEWILIGLFVLTISIFTIRRYVC